MLSDYWMYLTPFILLVALPNPGSDSTSNPNPNDPSSSSAIPTSGPIYTAYILWPLFVVFFVVSWDRLRHRIEEEGEEREEGEEELDAEDVSVVVWLAFEALVIYLVLGWRVAEGFSVVGDVY